ncbi:MAG: hypothetical protein K2I30_04415 [Clostridia bacterium]|nr:hypothetical protein [Clostridia bacterium]
MKSFKKIILTSLVLVACVLTLIPLGGCKKYPEYTAEKPYYISADFNGYTFYKSFNFWDVPHDLDAYYEFVKYYKSDFKEFCQKECYILNLGEPTGNPADDSKRSCFVYGILNSQDILENYYINQYVVIYDKKLGGALDGKWNIKDGESNWSIIVSLISVPVESELEGEFVLEFGKTDNTMYDKYVNIYCENVCIATCKYRTAVKIPLNWFESFFKNNLIYGGNV